MDDPGRHRHIDRDGLAAGAPQWHPLENPSVAAGDVAGPAIDPGTTVVVAEGDLLLAAPPESLLECTPERCTSADLPRVFDA